MKILLIATTMLIPMAAFAQGGFDARRQTAPPPPSQLPTTNAAPTFGVPADVGPPLGEGAPLPQTPAPFASDLRAPGPDSTTSGPLSNRPRPDAGTPMGPMPQMQSTMDQLPRSLPAQTMPAPTARGDPAMQQTETGNNVSGTAAKLGEAELDRLLRSPSGPPLPDADMGGHAGEAREEDELNRRLRVWQMRNKVGDQILAAATNLQKYRQIVEGKADRDGNPQQGPAGYQTAPQQMASGDASAAAAPKTIPLPVVTRVSGIGSRVTATVLIPYDGAKSLRTGDRLPNGMRVTSIQGMNVVVEMRDGSRRTLPWGDSVPAYEETAASQRPTGQPQPMPQGPPQGIPFIR